MFENLHLVALAVVGFLFVFSMVARSFPDGVGQGFAPPNAAQRDVARRRWDTLEGIKFILIGVILPIGYVFLKVMMFNEPTLQGFLIVGACSLLCFILGVRAIRRGLR